jgi:carbon monoxide dehydrogenase subunit G
MDIEGTYTLQAPVEEVWQYLVDLQALQHAMPGLERLESTGQLAYAFTLRIKQAPLRGVYQGKVMVDSAPYPDPLTSYRFSIEGDGQHTPFQGIWDIRLSQQHDNTVVAYSGALNPGKMSALLPPSLVKGAVKILIQQFFANLAEQLRTTTDALYLVPGFDESEAQEEYGDDLDGQTGAYGKENGRHALASFNEPIDGEPSLPARSLMHRLVRLVGLGNHDTALEEQWVTRLQRFGAFSVLLLLVWIGTRLPRRLLPRD